MVVRSDENHIMGKAPSREIDPEKKVCKEYCTPKRRQKQLKLGSGKGFSLLRKLNSNLLFWPLLMKLTHLQYYLQSTGRERKETSILGQNPNQDHS